MANARFERLKRQIFAIFNNYWEYQNSYQRFCQSIVLAKLYTWKELQDCD